MKRIIFPVLMMCLSACQFSQAQARQANEYTWEGVERIVAVGDIHGDYDNYIETLRLAGLVNRRGRWSGGTTHFVQTGDIPDRGPDTRKIMDHIDKLAGQAEDDGGRVHRLIGNHEAMNLYGDLRYVTEGEFEDFESRNSKALLDRYFELVMEDMQQNRPEEFASLSENYREEWEGEHPAGFVEHQQAWNPAWNPDGEYAQRTLELKTAVKINGIIFVHGGISDLYADMSLESLTQEVRAGLANFNYENPGMVEDECGPLWYRGLAGGTPEASPEVVTSILQRLSAERMVIGHTPTPGVIWPRYNARVVQIDTGISEAYGGYPAYLEITADGLSAGYPGGKLPLPRTDAERLAYLDAVIAMDPNGSALKRFRQLLTEPQELQPQGPQSEEAESAVAESDPESAVEEAPGQEGADSGEAEQPTQVEGKSCLREASAESAPAL